MNIYQSASPPKSVLAPEDAAVLSLQALAHIFSDDQLSERFIQLTGLTPETLRRQADQADVQVAVLEFLLSHEPDLIACAAALSLPPARFGQAHAALAGAERNTL